MIKHRFVFHICFIASLIVAGIILTVFVFKKTLFSDKYMITDIAYAPESVTIYNDPYVYKAISQSFSWENYYRTKWFKKDDITRDLQNSFPLIDQISIDQQDTHIAYITITFHDPTIVFVTPLQKVAVYNDDLYFLVSGNQLWADSLHLWLPSYTSWYGLQGILYEIDEYTLEQLASTINETLWTEHISDFIYMPGGKLFFVNYKGKQVYFNLQQDVNLQLIKLVDLENRFEWFEQLERIDLWSIDDIIVR